MVVVVVVAVVVVVVVVVVFGVVAVKKQLFFRLVSSKCINEHLNFILRQHICVYIGQM